MPHYYEITSVREILLVSSTERRVALWRRDGPRWVVEVETFIGEAELRLEAIDAAMYIGVSWLPSRTFSLPL